MQNIMEFLEEASKKLFLPIVIAILGTVVHIYRTNEAMSFVRFMMLTCINTGVIFSISVISQEVLEIQSEKLTWVLCGTACAFSQSILNLIQLVITEIAPDVARKFLGVPTEKDEE